MISQRLGSENVEGKIKVLIERETKTRDTTKALTKETARSLKYKFARGG